MKYSLRWINEMISIEEYLKNPLLLRDIFNLKGLEVEDIYPKKPCTDEDCCFDLMIPPNRPDLLSHIGLARELSGLLDKPLKLDHLFWPNHYKRGVFQLGILKDRLQFSQKSNGSPIFSDQKMDFKVFVEEPEICSFYAGQIITHVQVMESPSWLKKRLEFLGLNSINNIVDVTNWILQEWGQPLHAFDMNILEGSIRVKKANAKDTLVTLDNNKLELCGDELIISDDKKPLALAGIIGGKQSGVSDKTSRVFLESAVFAPYAVRRISRRFKLDTLSSFHFSRGVDSYTTILALQRASSLIQQVAEGRILKKSYQIGSLPKKKNFIEINKNHLEQRLDYSVSMKEFSYWMKKMNCRVKKKVLLDHFIIHPPYYRKDLNIKEDLIEEWARLKGYEFVQETLPSILAQKSFMDPFLLFLDKVKKIVKEQGFYQAINYSFIDSNWSQNFLGSVSITGSSLESPIFIKNPISRDLNSLRQSLLPGLFKNMIVNIRHGQEWGRIFEQGVSFRKNKDHFEEIQQISFILWGQKKTVWQDHNRRSVFFDLKSTVEALLNKINRPDFYFDDLDHEICFIHPKKGMLIKINNQIIGFIGIVNPIFIEDHKIRQETAIGEIDLSLLFPQPERKFHFNCPSSLPVIKRDISLIIHENQPVGLILEAMKQSAPKICKNISIIDCYEGGELKKGQRSITFRLIFQDDKKTLSEEQIKQHQEHIISNLKKWPVQQRIKK